MGHNPVLICSVFLTLLIASNFTCWLLGTKCRPPISESEDVATVRRHAA